MTKAKGKAEATKAKAKAKAKMTPKQMSVKAASLLKGIDNSVAIIDKQRTSIVQSAGQLAGILSGLSNAATAAPAKPAAPAKKAAAQKPAKKAAAQKPAKAKPEKAAKPAKAKPEKAAAQKPAKAKPEKAAAKPAKKAATKPVQKAPASDRPTVKDAIREMIAKDGPDTRAALYHKVTDKYGYWSRQSFYNALKDKKSFKETDGKVGVAQAAPAQAKTTDAEAAKFVDKVAGDAAVSSAT